MRRLVQILSILINTFQMKRKQVSTGDGLKIYGICRFEGDKGSIHIGSYAVIRSGHSGGNPVGLGETILSVRGGAIHIGNRVGISHTLIVSKKGVVIEDDALIGGGCRIYDSDFHSLDYETRAGGCDNDIQSAEIHIRKGAFIGAHSLILKGVTVGERSIVGAGSVVAKDIPAGEIWAGNPAKKIRDVPVRKDVETPVCCNEKGEL